MKKLIFTTILLLSLNTYSEWYDGLGDGIFSAIGGGLAGIGTTFITANPIAGIAATAAGGYLGRQAWEGIYNTFTIDNMASWLYPNG